MLRNGLLFVLSANRNIDDVMATASQFKPCLYIAASFIQNEALINKLNVFAPLELKRNGSRTYWPFILDHEIRLFAHFYNLGRKVVYGKDLFWWRKPRHSQDRPANEAVAVGVETKVCLTGR